MGGAEDESLDDDSNIFSLLPREPDPAGGGGGRDEELGPEEEKDGGGVANFDAPPIAGGGAPLEYVIPNVAINFEGQYIHQACKDI